MAEPHYLEIVSGIKFEPLFRTEEEYNRWSAEYTKAVEPTLKENAQMRRASNLESMSRMVD